MSKKIIRITHELNPYKIRKQPKMNPNKTFSDYTRAETELAE